MKPAASSGSSSKHPQEFTNADLLENGCDFGSFYTAAGEFCYTTLTEN